jgi:MFS family permease
MGMLNGRGEAISKEGRDILALYAFNFFKSLQFFGAVAVPFYLSRIGLNYGEMFALEAIFSFSMMVMEIPTGVVADRWGRKVSLFCGVISLGLGFLAFGVSESYAILALAEVVCAIGMTLVSGADRALVYELLKNAGMDDRASKVLARYEAAGTAGMFLGFPLGSLFVGSGLVPYKTALGMVFVFSAVALGIAGIVITSVKEAEFPRTKDSLIRHGIEGFLFIFKKPILRNFSLNFAVVSAFTFFMFWFYQSLLVVNKVQVQWFGFVGSAFNLTAMLLLAATPLVQRRFGTEKVLFFSSLFPGLLYITAAAIHGLPVALIAIFGVTNFRMFRAPMLNALINGHIESANRATVLSGISMIERVLIAILYPVVGFLTDKSLYIALAVLGVCTIVLSIALRVEQISKPR